MSRYWLLMEKFWLGFHGNPDGAVQTRFEGECFREFVFVEVAQGLDFAHVERGVCSVGELAKPFTCSNSLLHPNPSGDQMPHKFEVQRGIRQENLGSFCSRELDQLHGCLV